ncbi:MAG: DOMON domain-containing protein [Myxococcales bacterium]
MRSLSFCCCLLLAACSGPGSGGTATGSSGTAGTSGDHGTSGGSSSGASGGSSTSGGGSGSTSSGGSGGACAQGTSLATLPACTASASTTVTVPAGCVPTVDGSYHEGEWGDAACVTVGTDPVYLKYASETLYLAWPMTPACGCPAQLAFNVDGAQSLDGHQFALGIFDDPAGTNGSDSFESASQAGGWNQSSSVAAGIAIGNPSANGNATVTYELAIPFSQLGLTPGQAHAVGFGVVHANPAQSSNDIWPAGLTVPQGTYLPDNPSNWGQLSSSANWQ